MRVSPGAARAHSTPLLKLESKCSDPYSGESLCMARVESVKGTVFAAVVEAVQKLIADGQLRRERLDRWLEPGDVALLDSQISIAGWYDIRAFSRLNELLRDVAGDGSHEYLRRLGRESASRLQQAGLYVQLEYLRDTLVSKQTDGRARFEAFGRDLGRLTTLSGSIYNFGKWSIEPDPEHPLRYHITIADAAGFTDVVCWRIEGFINQMAAVRDAAQLWSWRRVRPDLVRFHMIRDL
jgi:hypothetical protein